MVKICCENMGEMLYFIDSKLSLSENGVEDKMVYYSSKFNEYGLPVYDGENGSATSYVMIQYCPWCGRELPKSCRDEWFERLEKLGFDSPFEDFDKLPLEFKGSEWWEAHNTFDTSTPLDET